MIEIIMENGYINANGVDITSSNLKRTKYPIPCISGVKYYVNGVATTGGNRVRVHEYDSNSNWLREKAVTGPWDIGEESYAEW